MSTGPDGEGDDGWMCWLGLVVVCLLRLFDLDMHLLPDFCAFRLVRVLRPWRALRGSPCPSLPTFVLRSFRLGAQMLQS